MGAVFAGRVAVPDPSSARMAEVAARCLVWLFPQLDGVRFDAAWSGPMDLTPSGLPFFESSPDDSVQAGLGFSGHGLAATRLGGRILASLVLGEDDRWSRMPVVGPPRVKLPPEPLRWPMVRTVAWAGESGDRAAERGRRPGFVRAAIMRTFEVYAASYPPERRPPPARKGAAMRHVHSGRRRSHAGGLGGGRVVSAAVALAVLLFACGSAAASPAASPSASPGATSILRVGWVQEPDSLNPFVGWQATSVPALPHELRLPHQPGRKTLQPRPELATKWSVSPDGTVWTFTIRSGVKWQDGVPLTARDVAFTFNYQLENNLWNLASYTDGITKAVAVDDVTVKIYTTAPKANMLQMIVPIIPEHIWSKVSGKAAGTTFQNNPPVERQRAVPGRRVAEGQVRAPRSQQGLLGRRSQGGRGHLPDVLEPQLDGQRPRVGVLPARSTCRWRSTPPSPPSRASPGSRRPSGASTDSR